MIKIFKNNSKLIYLTNSSNVMESGEYNVILSPELYWVKKVTLPVKKVSAAKKLAESIFEGGLPAGDYAYEVSKSDDKFIIVAYDKDNVSQIIKDKFIKEERNIDQM